MSVQILEKSKKKGNQPNTPDSLVYEIFQGKPIYYKGYQEVLAGTNTIEGIMADSTLQGWIKTLFAVHFFNLLAQNGYKMIVGELGINMPDKGRRGADVAIFKAERLVLNNKYSKVIPDIVIEIDVQADTEDFGGDMKYITDKINGYLENGATKVIWIFTAAKTILVSTEKGAWQVKDWEDDVEIMPDVSFNLGKML